MAQFTKLLKNRNFLLLWLSQIISQFGDRLNQMALIGLIYQRAPGSTFELAKLLSFTIIPVFLIGPVAGVYVDRWDRRQTMLICDFLRFVLVFCVPMFFLQRQGLTPIYIIVFLVFCLSRFYVPAKMSIIPDLVNPEDLLLANSLANITGMIAAIFGFGFGGFLVAWMGVSGAFYINALTFFVSAVFIFLITKTVRMNKERIIEVSREVLEVIKKSVVDEIKEGISYLFNQREIRFIVNTLFALWSALGAIYVIMIVFVQESLGTVTKDLGLLAMFLGVGLFIGSILYGRFCQKVSHFKTIFASLISGGIMLILFALLLHYAGQFLLAAALSFVFGLIISPIMIAANTMVHEVSDSAMRGKVFSSLEVVMHFAFLLFMLISSGLADHYQRVWILVGVGTILALIGIGGVIRLWLDNINLVRRANG
jgi:DHA3 family macrolide efflux protein-like MFS transporter